MNISQWKVLGGVAALLLLGTVGCTDPTVAPKSTVTGANYFNDPNSYVQFLAKVYGGLALSGQAGPTGQPDIAGIDEGFSQYLRLYWEHQELPSDEAVIGWNDIGLPEMNLQTWTSSSTMVVAMYYRIFFQVGMANEFLRQTTDAALAGRPGITPALKTQIQQYRAEARFLRAFSYWHGIDLFGNIPLVTEADPLGATAPKQSTRAAIYSFIVSELTAISSQLPAPGAATYGRATGPAAQMLLAEVYLNAGVYTGTPHWAEALAAAQLSAPVPRRQQHLARNDLPHPPGWAQNADVGRRDVPDPRRVRRQHEQHHLRHRRLLVGAAPEARSLQQLRHRR